ncbi:MAG TPA: hypothetical protein VFW96_28995 [Thermomicrobiales bacterium]|nr:hypothetical protein [Thermomicrobiales bacterium]
MPLFTQLARPRARDAAGLAASPDAPAAPSRSARWRWLVFLVLAYAVATVAMTWPLALEVDRATPPTGDALYQVWIARWVQHALVTDPLHLYDANIFYPHQHTLTYSDSDVPAALAAAPLFWLTGNALTANNLLVLATFVVAATGMYALVARLTGNRAAAFLAGLAYAFLPYRYAHLQHLNQLGHAWTPWVLLAFALLIERPGWRTALAFALLLTVQVLMSFYLAFQIAGALAVALAVALVADPRARRRRFLVALAAACGLAAVLVLPVALPYLGSGHRDTLERTLQEAERWSASPRSFFKAAAGNRVWGFGWIFEKGNREDAIFPGGLALAGAAAGLLGWRRRPPWTATLLLIGAAGFVLAFGPTLRGRQGGTLPLPYRFLFEHLPFFDGMRVPARFGVLFDFAVVALAGCGVAWAWAALRPRVAVLRRRWAAPALTAGLAALVLAELCSAPVQLDAVDRGPAAAAPYEWLARQPDQGPVMEFPASTNNRTVALAMYWSTLYWKPLVQGYSSFDPPGYDDLIASFMGDLRRPGGGVSRGVSYVNAENLPRLQALGVRYLVVHRDGYRPEDWPAVLAALDGLGGAVSRVGAFGDAVIYRVR